MFSVQSELLRVVKYILPRNVLLVHTDSFVMIDVLKGYKCKQREKLLKRLIPSK